MDFPIAWIGTNINPGIIYISLSTANQRDSPNSFYLFLYFSSLLNKESGQTQFLFIASYRLIKEISQAHSCPSALEVVVLCQNAVRCSGNTCIVCLYNSKVAFYIELMIIISEKNNYLRVHLYFHSMHSTVYVYLWFDENLCGFYFC